MKYSFLIANLVGLSLSSSAQDFNILDSIDGNRFTSKVTQFESTLMDLENARRREKSGDIKANAILGTVPLLGALLSGKYQQHQGMISDLLGYNADSFETIVDESLSKIASEDEERFAEIINEENDTIKTRLVYERMKDLESFNILSSSMSVEARSYLNSVAVMAISKRLTILSKQVSSNALSIDVLRSDYIKFSVDADLRLDELKRMIVNGSKAQQAAVEVQEGINRISRMPSSINGADVDDVNAPSGESFDESSKQEFDQLIKNLNELHGYMNTSYKAAVNFGLKGKDAERFQEATQIIGVVASVGMAISNPNPNSILNATLSISTLFGKKNNQDPDEIRHRQVMQALGVLEENQKILIANQKAILDNQVKIYQYLVNAQKVNFKLFKELNEKLSLLMGDSANILNAILTTSESSERINACRSFLNSRFKCSTASLDLEFGDLGRCVEKILKEEQPFSPLQLKDGDDYPSIIPGYFSKYSDMFGHFYYRNNAVNFAECRAELERVFLEGNNDILKAKLYSENYTSQYQSVIAPVYVVLNEILKKYFSNPHISLKSYDRRLTKALVQLENPRMYITNHFYDFRNYRTKELRFTKGYILKGISELYYTPALEKYAMYGSEIAPYYNFTDREGYFSSNYNLIKADELEDIEESVDSRDFYLGLLRETNMAIAQQALLAGNVVMPFLIDIVNSRIESFYSDVLTALYNNRNLASNFLIAQINNSLRFFRGEGDQKLQSEELYKKNLSTYTEYLSSKDASLIKKLGLPFEISSDNAVFRNGEDKIYLPLPSAFLVDQNRYIYSKNMMVLKRVKKYLMLKVYNNPDILTYLKDENQGLLL